MTNIEIVSGDEFNKVRGKIHECRDKGKKIIFVSDSDSLNRKVLEKLDIDIILINQKKRKNEQKQRNSGFNHVLARIAKQKNVKIGINLDEIIESRGKEKAEILARIRQNIKLCKKYYLEMKFISQKKGNERDKYDLKSLGLILGMSTQLTKNL